MGLFDLRSLRAGICTCLTLGSLSLNVLRAETPSAATRIPDVYGASLSNEAVNLPEALKGKVGVLVLGFSRSSGDANTRWGKRLAADYRESPTVVYYEMPVLEAVPRMVRGMVVRSIKSSVPVSEQARFVPILENEAAWKTVCHYGRPDDSYVLVVDGQGNVVWQTQGESTDTAYAALKEHVEALRSHIAMASAK
jgi:ATP10 protein